MANYNIILWTCIDLLSKASVEEQFCLLQQILNFFTQFSSPDYILTLYFLLS